MSVDYFYNIITLTQQPHWAIVDEEVGSPGFLFRVTLPENVKVDSITMTTLCMPMVSGEKTLDYGTIDFQKPAFIEYVNGMQVFDLEWFGKVSSAEGEFCLGFSFVIFDKKGGEYNFTCVSQPVTTARRFTDADQMVRMRKRFGF